MSCFGRGNWYRVLLNENTWFSEHKEILRWTLLCLDCFYLFLQATIPLTIIVVFYLVSVGIGYGFFLLSLKRPLDDGEIWGLGFLIGAAFMAGLGLILRVVYITTEDWRKWIFTDDFLLPTQIKIGEPDEAESELLSAVEVVS